MGGKGYPELAADLSILAETIRQTALASSVYVQSGGKH